MKKIIAMLLVLMMAFTLIACSSDASTKPDVKSEGVMTHAEYVAAAIDAEVVIETYVQGKQSWWDNKATVYTQDKDGAYFCYEMACSEADYAKLTPGTKIKVTGYKGEWAGEVEVMDATFEIQEGSYVAKPVDATGWIGNEAEMLKHQNELVSFKGMTVDSIEYKNGEPGDDIYVTLSKDGNQINFCVEIYLTGEDSAVYTTVGGLNVGDVVDVECFLYWYEGPNPHITAISASK